MQLCRMLILIVLVQHTSLNRSAIALTQNQEALLERIILDAQGENESKAPCGTMTYRIYRHVKEHEPVQFDATVRWDPDKAFSIFRLSDPSGLVGSVPRVAPIAEAVPEYMYQEKDKFYLYNHRSNTLFLSQLEYPQRSPSIYYLFDIYPRVVGSRCCLPNQSIGRKWSEMVGSAYARLSAESTLKLERLSDKIIRQTIEDRSGSTGTIDFSIEYSGYPVVMDYTDSNDPNLSKRSQYEWQKVGDVTVLRKCRIVIGDRRRPENEAQEIIEFETRSIALSKTRLAFDFNSLKALLPKNAKLMDRILKKSSRLNPSVPQDSNGVSDQILDDLSRELRNKGLLKP